MGMFVNDAFGTAHRAHASTEGVTKFLSPAVSGFLLAKDGPEDKFSLAPCAARMSELLGKEVKLAPDCIGEEVAAMVSAQGNGDVIMLENTRFYKEETANEAGFVEKFAKPFDMFVNDAFGTAHRAHASTEGVT